MTHNDNNKEQYDVYYINGEDDDELTVMVIATISMLMMKRRTIANDIHGNEKGEGKDVDKGR